MFRQNPLNFSHQVLHSIVAISGQQEARISPQASRPILGEITGTDGLNEARLGMTARPGFLCEMTGV
jgi:hypothetical protein